MHDCGQYFKGNSMLIPTKDIVARLLPHLFGTVTFFIHEQGKRYVAYRNIVPRMNTSQTSIILPAQCVKSSSMDTEFKLQIPMMTLINGQQEYVEVSFKNDKVKIIVRKLTIEVGLKLEVRQINVDGVVHLASMMKFCNGMEAADNESSGLDVSELSELHLENSGSRRVWSKSCKTLLVWSTKKEVCDTCTNSIRINRKRKGTNMNKLVNMKKPKVLGEQNININTCKLPQIEENKIPDIKLTVEDHNDMANILDQIVERGAPENFKIIFESQLQNCRKGLEVHQRRWDPQVISVCLALYLRSPRGYEDFKKSGLLVLPSKRLLQYYKNSIKQTTCFNEDNLKWMKQEANNKQVSEFGKHGGLIIDEMSIQDDLVIQKTGDKWSLVGMVDMDSTNNNIDIICNGKKKVQLATHALQFVFHGLTGFRWPVAYFGSNTATAHQLCSTYWKCVDVLDEHGFTVDYMTADGASTIRAFTSMLFSSNMREQKFKFLDVFDMNHSMCAIQDIMHVLKRIRNNIESSKLENNTKQGRYLYLNQPIVWDYWLECFHFNTQNGFGIHKKLTEDHFTLTPASKMRNQLALDVLDKNMLFLMKSYQATLHDPERLSSAISLLEHTSILTDIFCNCNQPIFSLCDSRFQSLNKTLKFFNDWEKTLQILFSIWFPKI
ncbi:unnamed protein product [Mytilus coruscus]|uniref:Transposable element P transposase-like RNase H domain-containing protein n=1 Tax=Mytilus coruscus TaxID=42192 RepID=A0A6J8BE39_MYTCO|nr:unnamed protein product [Mytilus coruscus]